MQGHAPFLAGILEPGHELAAAVDLHGQQRERQCAEEVHQEAFGIAGGGARVDPRHHELRDRADGPELLQRLPAIGVGHVVDLHEFPRPAGLGAVLPPRRPLREAAPPLGLDASLAERRGRPERSGRIAPAAKARSMIRPTVDTLRWPPLRASMAWMRALPMNGYLRRTSITALTSRGFQVRCRTRRGRVDFGASPPIPRPAADPDLLQRAFFAAPRGADQLGGVPSLRSCRTQPASLLSAAMHSTAAAKSLISADVTTVGASPDLAATNAGAVATIR